MICETIIRYDKEGKRSKINRIKSSSCYFIGFYNCFTFALPIFILTIIPNEFLAVFFMINLFFIAPLAFLYPTVRELGDGKDSLKFLLTNIISLLVKVIIGILFQKQNEKKNKHYLKFNLSYLDIHDLTTE